MRERKGFKQRYLFLQINCKFCSFLFVEEGLNRTCGAIDEPGRSSKANYKRVIIIFRDKNVVIARFRDKKVVIARFRDKKVVIARFRDKNVVIAPFDSHSDLSIAIFFYR